ncbi:MAG: hypothetical protein HC817_04270 [Saprospiraceae bacterium]|nr:hypothetical protein [Saprospiraceae bacterium]
MSMNIDYLEGFDKTIIAQGHQQNIKVSSGARLIELSDCKSCHQVKEKSVGPTYLEVAQNIKVRGKLNINWLTAS